jgi:chaperonin GroES
MKLALQVAEAKNFPWPNASNVKFPLLTIAALQFLARISLLTQGRNIAKVEILGIDEDGMKAKTASRISKHLTLQMQEDDVNWLDQDEAAKLAASIVGSAFKRPTSTG